MSKLDTIFPALQKREAYTAQLDHRAQQLLKDQLNGKDTVQEFAEVMRRQALTHMGSKVLVNLSVKPSKIVTDEAR